MGIDNADLKECLYRVSDIFTIDEYFSAFQENYPLEFDKWVRFYIDKGASSRDNAASSVKLLVEKCLRDDCTAEIKLIGKGRWEKKTSSTPR